MNRGPDPIMYELEVAVPPAKAFQTFTAELASWWPREFTWGRDALRDLGIECGLGGACYETGPHGFSCDWGRVLRWEPSDLVVLSWQINPDRTPQPDPAKASEVAVRFSGKGSATTDVLLEHRHFWRHGEGAAEYRAGMVQGWEYLLGCYAAALSGD